MFSCTSVLQDRRNLIALLFVFDLLGGEIDFLAMLSSINLSEPSRTLRTIEPFSVPMHSTNYGIHDPICRALHLFAT